ncbi:phage integrase central domain-containing protein [Sphingomonas abaci]|uniref:Integrase n=1 Tax=Sphingomonas abaci TaxID=237611 RepID=A0A7W7AL57_9SPHN|nr:integrase [Sphingomonas abaci]
MLTDVACRRAKGADKPFKMSDSGGLYLEVLPSGYKSWRWKYRFAGKEKRLVFGPYPDVTLTEARELKANAARTLRSGVDPAVDKRQRSAAQSAKAASTFQVVALEWYDSQEATWSPRYASIVKRSLEQDVFPRLGKLPIEAITTPLVLEVLRPIEERGAVETAHRVRQRISEIFARAIGSGIASADPAAVARSALGKAKKSKSCAVRTVPAARKVLQQVEAQPAHPLTKLASRLLALTVVRSSVVRLAEPAEFEGLDGDSPIWRIPPAKLKLAVDRKEDAAFEFIVPLSRQAVQVVRLAMDLAGRGPLIFRSVRHPRRAISDSTVSKLYREAGFSGVHVPHGWRSTFSTVMNERALHEGRAGDRAIIDLMLAHVPSGVEAAYNRAAYMPRRRELAQEWADLLSEGLVDPAALLNGPRQS